MIKITKSKDTSRIYIQGVVNSFPEDFLYQRDGDFFSISLNLTNIPEVNGVIFSEFEGSDSDGNLIEFSSANDFENYLNEMFLQERISLISESDPLFTESEAALFEDGDKQKLDNQSGTNTGDETLNSIKSKRPIKSIDGQSIEGIGNLSIPRVLPGPYTGTGEDLKDEIDNINETKINSVSGSVVDNSDNKNPIINYSNVFAIWAEENGGLGNNTFEWAFGNGANTPINGGIVIPFTCELIAMTCKANNNTSSQVIQIVVNGSPNTVYSVTALNGVGSNKFSAPLQINSGSRINFRTVLSGGASGPNTVCAWFKILEVI